MEKIKAWEQAVIFLLNLDGWNLTWTGDGYEHYDAIGTTPKGFQCVIEMKFRNQYYQDKMLEKYKYDSLMLLPKNIVKLYFVNDPKGNFMYYLNTLKMPNSLFIKCPDTTMWTKKKVDKQIYLLKENQASRININLVNKVLYIFCQ